MNPGRLYPEISNTIALIGDHFDEKVKAAGNVRKGVDGDMIMSVNRYEQIKKDEYEEDYP
jgi:hypothetical protein